MKSRSRRTLAIFGLALSYWKDSRRLRRARRRLSDAAYRQFEDTVYAEGGMRFRVEALRLGGLIIKVGQFLSARTDVLPLAFTQELRQLQDQVPAAPWPAVRTLMERMWARPLDEIFAEFEEEAVAAASLGQVHRARLVEGPWVAVKVQRPGIEDLARIDLAALRTIMRFLEKRTRVGRRVNALRLFEEFETLVGQELDYRQEEQHLLRFREQFAADPRIMVPQAWTELTRERVLVMEYLTGLKLTDVPALVAAGLDPRALADLLIEAYLRQIAVDGFVQIDPHAGNFFADAAGRLVLLDFGMVAEIPRGDLGSVGSLLRGVLAKDAAVVVTQIERLGFIRPGASPRLMKRAVQLMLDQLGGTPLAPGPALDRAVQDFQDFLYEEPLQFPARYMFLGRAIGMLFGLVSSLNPEINWLEVLKQKALPLLNAQRAETRPAWVTSLAQVLEAVLGRGSADLVMTGADWLQGEADSWFRVPGQMRHVLTLMEDGELPTQPELTPVLRRLDRMAEQGRAQLYSLWALLAAAGALGVHAIWPRAQAPLWAATACGLALFAAALAASRKSRGRSKRHGG